MGPHLVVVPAPSLDLLPGLRQADKLRIPGQGGHDSGTIPVSIPK